MISEQQPADPYSTFGFLRTAVRSFWAVSLIGCSVAVALADEPARRPNLPGLSNEAVRWLSGYLRIDTSNPPGREAAAAEYLAGVLRREGIQAQVIPAAPGRANVYARIRGVTRKPGLALVHHMDVAPADPKQWTQPPFGGRVREGAIWGRGAVDAKGLGVAHLAALVAVKRSGRAPLRDLLFVATADEESGGRLGIAWLLENRPELFEGIGYALAEGGVNVVRDDRLVFVGLETTQKVPVWLRITARGSAGHAGYARADAAPERLVKGLDRLLRYRWPAAPNPAVERYLTELAAVRPPENGARGFRGGDVVRNHPERLDSASQALVHNTVALTVLRAGGSTNTVPGLAYAEVDCRLTPGSDPDDFIEKVTEIVNDPDLEIEPLLVGSPSASPGEGELFEAIRRATQRVEEGSAVGPAVIAGFTDASLLRAHGLDCYGFDPFRLALGESTHIHREDERLPIADLHFAIEYCFAVIQEFLGNGK